MWRFGNEAVRSRSRRPHEADRTNDEGVGAEHVDCAPPVRSSRHNAVCHRRTINKNEEGFYNDHVVDGGGGGGWL